MNSLVLKVENLVHCYGSTVILNDISFHVGEGEFVGLVGVNGAGKSTLIKSILDFVSIKSGVIEIFGQDHRMPIARGRLSFLPEKFQPPYYLKGRDFLEYMGELHCAKVRNQDIKNVFETLGLDLSVLQKSARHYSKGMAQKLGLAASFLVQQQLLMMDEPMSGLDPKARSLLKKYLLTLKSNGKTLFFSTHLLNDIESLCDRIIILHEGEIKFDGSPARCCGVFERESMEAAYMACIGAAVD